MRELASFVMKGPKQAIMVAMFCTGMPMLFWLGASIISLVTLRQGIGAGLNVLVWAILPALGWWFAKQDPVAIIVILTSLAMAAVLRASASWQASYAMGVLVSVVIGLLVPWLAPDMINLLLTLAEQVFQKALEDNQIEYTDEVRTSLKTLMIASFVAVFYAISTVSLFLARSWQSALYNPEGWRQEFHTMRLSPKWLAVALLATVITPAIGIDGNLVFLSVLVPVLVCGLALIHGVIARKKLGGQWLFAFYLVLAVTFPTMLMIVGLFALLDSAVDFRGKIDRVTDNSNEL